MPTSGDKPGPRCGKLIADMPPETIEKKGGPWNAGRQNMRKSKIETFMGDTVIAARYPRGSGSTGTDDGGVAIGSVIGMPRKAAVFSFQVFHPKGFNPARGGKLFGFGIGSGKASGGNHSSNGASHRVMWQSDFGAISYIYPPDGVQQKNPDLKPHKYGNGFWGKDFAKALSPGEWHTIEVGVKLNTFDGSKPNQDGIAYLCIDGKSRELTNMIWMGKPTKDANITMITGNTFFGGPENSPVEQTCYYKGFKLYEWNDAGKSQVATFKP